MGEDTFSTFFATAEPRLRRAFVAAYGGDRGREATAEALAYAWEHWSEVEHMRNPMGYLYRVGRSRSRDRKQRVVFVRSEAPDAWVEPGLPAALAALTDRQRVAVTLVHGYGRGIARLRALLGVREDV